MCGGADCNVLNVSLKRLTGSPSAVATRKKSKSTVNNDKQKNMDEAGALSAGEPAEPRKRGREAAPPGGATYAGGAQRRRLEGRGGVGR